MTNALYGIWVDMNEPSVFDWQEMTFPPTAQHILADETSVPHYKVHNAYGAMMTMATYQALLKRDGGRIRPFLLTRSAFFGNQQYGAIWTGDNLATYTEARSIVH